MAKGGMLYPNTSLFSNGCLEILKNNRRREQCTLAQYASFSREARRLEAEEVEDRKNPRPAYFHDTDRIIHCGAYTRYIDKTQVFFEIDNDHVTRRVLHVQLVSKIGRTLARFFRANEDLVEAAALGHDLGHTPFGHAGESFLAEKLKEKGHGSFVHNAQSVRRLMVLENQGRGLNLTLQVLDAILGHNGELFQQTLRFDKHELSFEKLQAATDRCLGEPRSERPERQVYPSTIEGVVVRLSDVLAYLGRDIEDAVLLGVVKREELPGEAVRVLGDNNRSVINSLAMDLTHHSRPEEKMLGFSEEGFVAMKRLYQFNMERIYMAPKMEAAKQEIRIKLHRLFDLYLNDLKNDNQNSNLFAVFLNHMPKAYRESTPDPRIVADFISGMTDRYFNKEAKNRIE